MKHPDTYLDILPEYQGDQRLVTRRQDTFDIIREILRKHRHTIGHYDMMVRQDPAIWKGSAAATAENLYYYAKKHLPYVVEPTLKQTVKTPAAILEERHDFGNDCKHYASFIVGICEALRRVGHPVKCFYRFASYNKKHKSPGHVFAVIVDHGREIWVDPVPEIGGFNRRALSPVYTFDKMPPMSKNGNSIGSLYDISGIPIQTERHMAGYNPDHLIGRHHCGHWLDELPGHTNSRLHVLRDGNIYALQHHKPYMRGVADIGKAKKKHKGLHIKIKAPHIKVQPGKLIKKVGLATSRNAYLLLLKLNVFHMATKIWQKAAHDKNSKAWKDLAHKWENLGGKASALYNNVKRGVNTYNKLHKSSKHISGMAGLYPDELVSGINDDMLAGVGEEYGYPDYIGFYHDEMSIPEILVFVHENHHRRRMRMGQIGVAQVAVAAGVIAAAAPIIKALSGLLKSFGINTNKAQEATDADTQNLAEAHNAEGDNTDPNGTTTHADGTQTEVQNNADGSQTMVIKKVPGLKESEQGDNAPDSDPDDETETKVKTVTKTKTKVHHGGDEGDGSGSFLDNVKDFVSGHKVGVISTAGGLVILGIGASMKKKKGNMLKPALTIAGLGALAFGGYNLLAK